MLTRSGRHRKASGTVDAMMSPMPATVVRAAVPQDFDAIVDLVAVMSTRAPARIWFLPGQESTR
jgi:hypothetical protein